MANSQGVWTFLFTDIEGSTKLWEAHPERMGPALARHDAILRETFRAHSGHVFKTIGDAFCVAFVDAADALAAAVQVQQALEAEAWPEECTIRVRMAIHTGEAQERDGDYFGRALNRVARILGAGHGGQILLSSAAKALGEGVLPDGCSTADLGEHRLKDLGRPVQLYQLSHIELDPTFLPLRSLESNQHNLPLQLTSFVGRERELQEVRELLGRTRLLTLTGSGGCGKTRLALHVAAGLLEEMPDGVWYVELAPISVPGQAPHAVAGVMGLRDQPGRSITQALIESLSERRMVLILDNCEHLIEECARFAHELLVRCPGITMLATSREPLGIAGETTYRVPSLSVPDGKPGASWESMQQFESVGLFVDRAQTHRADLALDSRNAEAIASVCQRLDGIPLAIELAAARVQTMTVEEIDRRLDQRFRLLTGGSRSSLPRQQTLRSLVDWSYDLLTPLEQSLLRRVSVFSGGWTLEAAESVCSSEDLESWEVAELLSALVQKSLVIADLHGETSRYGLLQTVRQYASDRLSEAGNQEVYDRHLAYFVELAAQARDRLTGPETQAALAQLDAEYDNIRAALTWSCRDADRALLGLRLAGRIWRYWFMRGRLSEGRAEFRALLSSSREEDTADRALALHGASVLAIIQADHAEGRRLAHAAIAIWQKLGDLQGETGSLNALANCEYEQGHRLEAKALYEKCLEINRRLGARMAELAALSNLGFVLMDMGQVTEARVLLAEAEALCRELGASHYLPSIVASLANASFTEQDFERAVLEYPGSIELHRELGDKRNISQGLSNFALTLIELGRLEGVAPLLAESLELAREIGDKRNLGAALASSARLEFARGDMVAARLRCVEALAALSESDESMVGSTLRTYACAAIHSGDAEEGVRIFGATVASADGSDPDLSNSENARVSGAVHAARLVLGDRFDAVWASGAGIPARDVAETVVAAGDGSSTG